MDSKTYQSAALRTNTPDLEGVSQRLACLHGSEVRVKEVKKKADLLHSSLGLVTESAEFADMIKKHIFYGRELDEINLKEEIGDICWYAAIALEALGSSFEEVMATNIEKLKARYPDKFTEEAAVNRDLTKEREILEK